jgi:hypothetical protein
MMNQALTEAIALETKRVNKETVKIRKINDHNHDNNPNASVEMLCSKLSATLTLALAQTPMH